MKEAVRQYLSALEAGDIERIVSLFEPTGWVHSPFLGRMTAREFFPKLAPTDCEFIDELMTKYSRYEHSQPNEVPIPMPLPDDLKADLDRLKRWRDGFIQRANN